MEYHYTYLLICNETQERYIGVRTSKVKPNLDCYWSSSRTVKSMISQGFTFTKSVLKIFENRKDAAQHEIDLHKEHDVVVNSMYLNKAKASTVRFDRSGSTNSDVHRMRLKEASAKRAPRPPHSTETKKKMSLKSKGRTLSEEARVKISNSRKGKPTWNKGLKGAQIPWNLGISASIWIDPDTGKEMSRANFARHYPDRMPFIMEKK
jgi:hypothetical protein